MDETEELRRRLVEGNAAAVESNDIEAERTRLEALHGKGNVWDTKQLQQEFAVTAFMAPFCVVRRKSDNMKGVVEFQHFPRLYFKFDPA